MMLRDPVGRARPVLLAALALFLIVGAVTLATGVIGGDDGREPGDSVVTTGAAGPAGATGATGSSDPVSDPDESARSGTERTPAGSRTPESSVLADADPVAGSGHPDAGTVRDSTAISPPPAEEESRRSPPGAPPPDVAELLRRAERTYGGLASLRARFHQTIEVPLMNRRREGHGIWYQRGRDRFRMDFLDPPDDEIVADGTHLWLYYPSTNPGQVIKSSLGSDTEAGTADVLARILAEARSAYEGSYVGREGVEGVETHLVSLRPLEERSPYRRVRVWIGTSDDLVRRFEITEANETVRTVTLTELDPNSAIPAGTFRFEPPPDADVFER